MVELSDNSIRYNADGTGEQELHVRVKIQNEAGAKQFSVISLGYAGSSQTAKLEELRVTHSDGTTEETPASDAMDLPAPVTQQAPLYSDLKVLQAPVRGLRAGDRLEYRLNITIEHPEAPSQFWNASSFLQGAVVLQQTIRLDVPAGKYVQVWSPEQKPVVAMKDGRKVYTWTYSQLKPTSQQKQGDDGGKAPSETRPSVAWTTFHSWAEVGDWYRSLSAPRAVPTDALRAQAESITKEAKSSEEQVQALYTFVSTRIRYVGVDFGTGRYEPHPAAEVLANRYGDCKDKDTLLEALLRAKGFETTPALIGVNVDMIPELPSPLLFNHVITTVTLPTGRIWLDSTPEVEPYRLLAPQIRDKQALVIPASGVASLEKTPAQPPFAFTDVFHGTGAISADGELKGHIEITTRSDAEPGFRLFARNLAPAQWDQGAQYLANLLGFSGTASHASFAPAEDLSPPMRITYDYTRKPFGDWDNLRIIPLYPTGVGLPAAPEKQPDDAIDLGAPRTESAVSELKLDARFRPDLPSGVHVKTPFATVDKTYSFADGVLTVKRTVLVLQEKVPAASWKDYAKFIKDAELDGEPFIQLLTAGRSTGETGYSPTDFNYEAADLVSEAARLEQTGNWVDALTKLDAAKTIAPEQPYLWSNYGFVAMRQHRLEDAKAAYQHELDHHPDEAQVAVLYAGALRVNHENAAAIALLQGFSQRNPAADRVPMVLASLQAETSLADAISTLRAALQVKPDDVRYSTALASYLVRDKQDAEAAALLKPVLDKASDPGVMNDASYVLAQTGADLQLAEAKSRASISLLEGRSKGGIGEANWRSFADAALLVASWDTLGYTLMQEGKDEEASHYLEAAWSNRPDITIGRHYGQVLEKLHHAQQALRVYKLAISGHRLTIASPERQAVQDAIAGLEKTGLTAAASEQDLQAARTFRFAPKPVASKFLSAIYRVQVTAEGTGEVQRVSGASEVDRYLPAIEGVHLPGLVPVGSSARLLRDAVVTCSAGEKECELVLMPMGSMAAEHPDE